MSDTEIFYPKSRKEGRLWKLAGYILLTMGSSALADITRVIVADKIIIEHFIGENVIIEFNDLKFIKNSVGEVIAIEGRSDRLNLSKLADPNKFINKLISLNFEI